MYQKFQPAPIPQKPLHGRSVRSSSGKRIVTVPDELGLDEDFDLDESEIITIRKIARAGKKKRQRRQMSSQQVQHAVTASNIQQGGVNIGSVSSLGSTGSRGSTASVSSTDSIFGSRYYK